MPNRVSLQGVTREGARITSVVFIDSLARTRSSMDAESMRLELPELVEVDFQRQLGPEAIVANQR